MLDESNRTIYHKLLLGILSIYSIRLVYLLANNENNILTKIKTALLKTRLIDYSFLLLSIVLLGLDYYENKSLTPHERIEIHNIIHLSTVVTLTALCAHLDLYVLPAMISIILWVVYA